MENNLKITNSKMPLEEYFEIAAISDVTQNKLKTIDFVAIPERYDDGEFYFAQETIDFIKFCRQTDVEHSFDILSDGDIKVRSLHSFDIWMPVIWISAEILLPIAINVEEPF